MLEGDCAVAVHHLHVGVQRVVVGVPVGLVGVAGGQGGQEQRQDRAHYQAGDTRHSTVAPGSGHRAICLMRTQAQVFCSQYQDPIISLE